MKIAPIDQDYIAQCEDEGVWPGYEATVQALNLPAWAYGKEVAA
jgi:hypothetical protein